MKTKLLTALLALTAVCTTKADFLFWEADDVEGITYNYASIYSMDGDSKKVYLQNAGFNSANAIGDVIEKDSIAAAVLSSEYSSMTYYVELYNSEMGIVATSEGISGDSGFAGYISPNTVNENMTSHQRLALSTVGFNSVPEPTSGILMLLGMGLLGLKRKRA